MSLPWVRLDVGFPFNPKTLGLVADGHHRAAFAYVCGLAYAGGQGTAGFIPRSALPFIHARTEDAEALAEAGLWRPAPGGWDVNDWAEYQPADDERQKRREAAQKAAAARWRKEREKGATK